MANSKSKNIWIEREMILSPAFRKLKGRAMEVLLLFLYRRQWKQAGRKGKWYTTNNGEIVFPYKEAKKRFKIQKSSFFDQPNFTPSTYFFINRYLDYLSIVDKIYI